MRKYLGLLLLLLVSNGAWPQATNDKPDENVAYFKQENALASRGNPKALVCASDLYMLGFGTARDSDMAMKLYKSASDKSDQLGKLRIGQDYAWGIGVAKDTTKGIEIFRDLMSHGYMPAASELAVLYFNGDGVPKDYTKALELLRMGAAAGDYWAEARLGLMYHSGKDGVKKDETEAQKWLQKAANHNTDCISEFGFLTNFIISGYLKPIDTKDKPPTGTLRIQYTYHNGRAENPVVLISSGWPDFDHAWLEATRIAKLPPWPASFHTDDKTFGFLIPGDDVGGPIDSGFAATLHDAITASLVMPKVVLLYGSKGTGKVVVSFDFLDGKASNAVVVTSSNDPNEDAAAIKAVEEAHYPSTPPPYAHKKLHLSIRIIFENITPSATSATSNPPAAATKGS